MRAGYFTDTLSSELEVEITFKLSRKQQANASTSVSQKMTRSDLKNRIIFILVHFFRVFLKVSSPTVKQSNRITGKENR